MSTPMIGMICIAGMLALIAFRAPISLAMSIAGFIGFGWIVAFEPALSVLPTGPFETLSNYSFSPIPMFILMGVFASKSGMSQQLFQGAKAMFGSWRGGMGLAALTSCGIFSAISGSSMATAASRSRVALPEMEKNGYSPSLASGVLAAGGTLGIMIPPSTALLLYGLITEQSIGDMFIAGVIPGLLGLVLYGVTVAVIVTIWPNSAQPGKATSLKEKIYGLKGLLPFTFVFLFIIGGIYSGWFTPTEAAAVGAAATFFIAVFKGMRWVQFKEAIAESLLMTAMIFFMLIGAEIFGYFLSVSRISFSLVELVDSLQLSPFVILLCVLAIFMLLGCVMDSIAMLLLTVPVVYPLIEAAGFDPIWFGIVAVITVELGLITPPVGMNVFVIKSVAPHISIKDMYKGVMPFVIADLVRLCLIVAFPFLAIGLL